jgi:5'-nucleotidase
VAQVFARQVAEKVLKEGLPHGYLLNVNVPNVPGPKGLVVCPMGRRFYHPHVQTNQDPRGKTWFWLGGEHDRFSDDPSADGPMCEAGYATLTPLQMDMTAWGFLEQVAGWFDNQK